MSINTSSISKEQKKTILNLEESHFTDLKSVDIAPAKLTKTLAAFANADGGELYIGIDEDKSTNTRYWRGFNNPEEANGLIQTFESFFPLGQDFSYTFLACEGSNGYVIQATVQKTKDIKKSSDGTIYIRRGAQNLPLVKDEEITRLRRNKGLESFETETVTVDLAYITNSEPSIKFMLEVIPTGEPEVWLKKQLLIHNNKPTVAGILLFAEEPQAILTKRCGIKVFGWLGFRTTKPGVIFLIA